MNCNCFTETDKKLKEMGHNVRTAGRILTVPEFKTRFVVPTEWVDKSKVSKKDLKNPPPIIAEFCPFCGKSAVPESAQNSESKP